ncbi:MAG: DJ-1/PfpI family protein [Candidatus Micrarchaeota archaeon]
MAKVLFIVAPENFRDEELFEPKEELGKAGYQVVIASTKKGTCSGSKGGSVISSMTIGEAKVDDYAAVVFVGGNGAQIYFENKTALNIASEAVKLGKILGAICIAPIILANAGILKGKKATVCNAGFGSEMESKGAKYTGEHVTVDGKIVTANGPKASREFGRKIVELLGNI